jgi:hypothetical protein
MSWLTPFRRRLPRTPRTPPTRCRYRPDLEALEDRTLLSANTSIPTLSAVGPIIPQLAGEGFSTIPPTGPAEVNPYGVAFVPAAFPTTGTLQPGDVLVANFNGATNVQGTGTTIVRITPSGARSTFFTSDAQHQGLSTALGVLKSGFVIVGNAPNNGTGGLNQGSLQILDKNGNVVSTLTDANLLKDPWDLTINDQGSTAQVFVSNVSGTTGANGTVTRVDLSIPATGAPTVTGMHQIASGYATRLDAGAFVLGPGGLAYDPATDKLYVAAEDEQVGGTEVGTIFSVPTAGTTTTDQGKGSVVFADATHLHGPIGLVLLPNGDLMTANGDGVNTDPNQPSELVEFTTAGQFVNQFSIDPLNGAAFGLNVISNNGQVRFAALNDNQDTLTVWPFVPTFDNPYVLSTVPPTGPAELNPYGVAFVPSTFPTTGTLQPGDVLVANFNGATNVQGTGTTIVRITPSGARSTFFTSDVQHQGLSTALGVLKSGFVIVGNVPNNGTGGVLQGSLQILDKNGNLVKTLTDANLLKDPWDLTINDQGSTAQVFVSNVSGTTGANGTVTRVDLSIPATGAPTVTGMHQIASGYATRLDAGAFVLGPGGLAYDPLKDTLYVAAEDEKVNGTEVGTIFAVPNAGTTTTDQGKGSVVYADATHLHGPIGLVLAPNGDLITANGDGVNTDPNQASELVEFTPAGQFISQFSIDPNNGAAFGLNLTISNGQLRFAALNDNQSTLSLSTFTLVAPPPTVISSLTPFKATEGSAAVTLTVNGSNFTRNSTVLFNGTVLATTYVSSSMLTAIVPASLLADEATASITVNVPGTAASSAQSFAIVDNTPTLTASASGGLAAKHTTLTIQFTDTATEDHKLKVNWGDGTSTVMDLGISKSGSATIKHKFKHAHKSITVTVVDDEGTVSNTVQLPMPKPKKHPKRHK